MCQALSADGWLGVAPSGQEVALKSLDFWRIEGEKIRVVIAPPELRADQGGIKATAAPVLELQVATIEILDPGSGYAIEKTVPIFVEPAPPTG